MANVVAVSSTDAFLLATDQHTVDEVSDLSERFIAEVATGDGAVQPSQIGRRLFQPRPLAHLGASLRSP